MYEEIMTNDDNLESNLLTSSLLKMLSQVEHLYCLVAGGELTESVFRDLTLQVNYSVVMDSIGYHSLHRSTMECLLTVTTAGVAGWECECWITYN